MRDVNAAAHAMLVFLCEQQQHLLGLQTRALPQSQQQAGVATMQKKLLSLKKEQLLGMSLPELQGLLGQLCRAGGDYAGIHQLQLPTRRTLRGAGRSDLLYGLQIHGSNKIADVCGVRGLQGDHRQGFDVEEAEGRAMFL
jgi:hypothetical protein